MVFSMWVVRVDTSFPGQDQNGMTLEQEKVFTAELQFDCYDDSPQK